VPLPFPHGAGIERATYVTLLAIAPHQSTVLAANIFAQPQGQSERLIRDVSNSKNTKANKTPGLGRVWMVVIGQNWADG
jgi:hypothetical protein